MRGISVEEPCVYKGRSEALQRTSSKLQSDPRLEGDRNDESSGEHLVVVDKKSKPKAKPPSLYKVSLLNDDYTPMDFVTMILESVFGRTHEQATKVMLEVHNKGKGVAGVFPYEIAESKVAQVTEKARSNEYPLQCVMEKA